MHHSIPQVSHGGEKLGVLLPFLVHVVGAWRCKQMPTMPSMSQNNKGCRMQLCNRMFHCCRPLTLNILKSSKQLRFDFHLALTTRSTSHGLCVCVFKTVSVCMFVRRCVCLNECLRAVGVVEWCTPWWLWTFPACSSAPARSPGRTPCFSWESHVSISDSALWVWQGLPVW